MNTISYGELSDPLCDGVNRGLTLVRLLKLISDMTLYEMLLNVNVIAIPADLMSDFIYN